jgi:hypothetical protein
VTDFDDLDDLERELGPSMRVAPLRPAAAQITEAGLSVSPRLFVFEIADPGRVDSAAADFDALRKGRGSAKAIEVTDNRPTPGGAPSRHWWRITTAATAAAQALIAGGTLVLTGRDDASDETRVGTDAPENTGAVPAVVESFMDAWVAGDGAAVGSMSVWAPCTSARSRVRTGQRSGTSTIGIGRLGGSSKTEVSAIFGPLCRRGRLCLHVRE